MTPVPPDLRLWQLRPPLLVVSALIGPLMILLGLSVTPDARGHGTHVQFGMEPCAFPAQYDLPCPTCGVTTSIAYASRGDLWGAARTQLFGAALFAAILGLSIGSWNALLRRRPLPLPRPFSPFGFRILASGLALLLFAWWLKAREWREDRSPIPREPAPTEVSAPRLPRERPGS